MSGRGAASPRFGGLDHVGFTVADLDRSIAWYTTFLDAPPLLRRTWDDEYIGRIVGYRDTTLDCAFWTLPGGALLELIQYVEPEPGAVDMETRNVGNGHLCLQVADLRAEYARLRGHVAFRSEEPVEIPSGPYRDGLACYLRDPDGITVELIEPPPGGLAVG